MHRFRLKNNRLCSPFIPETVCENISRFGENISQSCVIIERHRAKVICVLLMNQVQQCRTFLFATLSTFQANSTWMQFRANSACSLSVRGY